jgi:hypothetical protein
MRAVFRSFRSVQFAIAAAILAAVPGCCGPMVISHRVSSPSIPADEMTRCHCGSIFEHAFLSAKSPHRPLPGSDLASKGVIPPVDSDTIQPPHSKFHPVPTRPVFAPREEYPPPKPLIP